MSRLAEDVRSAVRPAVTEERLHASWKTIAERSQRAPRPRRTALLAGVALAAVAALAWLSVQHDDALTLAGEPLATAAPRAFAAPTTWSLSDGSVIEIGAGAILGVTENDGDGVGLTLAAGRAGFEVRPGGPRRWHIDAGACVVEVLGTGFSVDRRPDGSVRVEVRHGRVAVRSGASPDVTFLERGESVEVPAPTPIETVTAAASPAATASEAATTTAATAALAAPVIEAPAATGEASEAAATSPRELLRAAERASEDGRPWDAAPLLRTLVAAHPDDEDAPLAAFTLARIELDRLDHPERAAAAFARALALGLSGDLAEIARARRVEALARAGDRDAATQAAEVYLARHPDGAWRDRVEAWVDGVR